MSSSKKQEKKKKLLLTFHRLLALAAFTGSLFGAVGGQRPVVLLADVDVAPTVVVDDEAA